MMEANVQNDRGVMWSRITKILIAFIVLMIIVDVVLYVALTKSEQNRKIRPAIFFRSIDILSKSFVVAIDDNNCGMRWITMGQRGELEDRGNYYGSMEEDGSFWPTPGGRSIFAEKSDFIDIIQKAIKTGAIEYLGDKQVQESNALAAIYRFSVVEGKRSILGIDRKSGFPAIKLDVGEVRGECRNLPTELCSPEKYDYRYDTKSCMEYWTTGLIKNEK